MVYSSLIRPLLFLLDPEKAHHVTTGIGQFLCSLPPVNRLAARRSIGKYPNLQQRIAGITFPNPVGIAAGFDKNGEYTELLRFLGFGYAEYGSITARASRGNPSPRLFRLPGDRALINRMGLNNRGSETICRDIAENKRRKPFLYRDFPIGINIAKTHDPSITGDEAIRDYVTSYFNARFIADYITLNISCPNTREGKTFEDISALRELLDGIFKERNESDPPLFVKFSPDQMLQKTDELAGVCEDYHVNGYLVSNTSSRRGQLKTSGKRLDEIGSGGLSGHPLFAATYSRIRHLRCNLPANRILIACGGIDHPDKAIQLLKAGANLLQIYTGLVYQGPSLVRRINRSLELELKRSQAASLDEWQQSQPEFDSQ